MNDDHRVAADVGSAPATAATSAASGLTPAVKITSVDAQTWSARFAGEVQPAWAPGTTWTGRSTTLYIVTTDEGITGYGAGAGQPAYVRERVAPRLVGQDPFAIERHTDTIRNLGGPWLNHPIPWGLELALWDVVGKAAGQPLYRLWGGYTDRIKAYASCCEVARAPRAPRTRSPFASGAIARSSCGSTRGR